MKKVALIHVTLTVAFHRLYAWAIEPRRHTVDRHAARADATVYRESFRYVRAERRPQMCAPWVMGAELGWRVHSPIDVTLTPLDQLEVDSAETTEASRVTGRSELWGRERSHLAVERTSWLRLFQFSTARGWENMFLPNGAGTVEWRLGWAADIPRGYFLLVMPSDAGPAGLEIPTGVLSNTVTTRMSAEAGASLAIRPTSTIPVKRGQEIARIVLLHADSLQAAAAYPESDAEMPTDV